MIEEKNLVEVTTNLRVQYEKLKDKMEKGEDILLTSLKTLENRILYFEKKMTTEEFMEYGKKIGYLE